MINLLLAANIQCTEKGSIATNTNVVPVLERKQFFLPFGPRTTKKVSGARFM
jgi:hypothetical protein